MATSGAGSVVASTEPTATDDIDGSDPVACRPGSGSTFPLGKTTVGCSAGDQAGNSATATFVVTVIYRWDGFLQPINDTAHQTGTASSVFEAGSTVPVKFQLKLADGTPVPAGSLPIFPTPERGSVTSAAVDECAYADPGSSGSTFSYDPAGGYYQYNWKTGKDLAGYWWRLSARLPDGTTQHVAIGLR